MQGIFGFASPLIKRSIDIFFSEDPGEAVNGMANRHNYYRLLRPEFVRRYPVPLSSDAFSAFSKDSTANAEITKATLLLYNKKVPGEFSLLLSSVVLPFLGRLKSFRSPFFDMRPSCCSVVLASRSSRHLFLVGYMMLPSPPLPVAGVERPLATLGPARLLPTRNNILLLIGFHRIC